MKKRLGDNISKFEERLSDLPPVNIHSWGRGHHSGLFERE